MSDFGSDTEPFRKELLAHCYRMLASVHEAEDAVQETYLRAWRSWSAFEGRSSVRVWLYRIATNVCLTAREQRGRRALPSGLGAPATDLSPGTPPDDPSVRFIEPIEDSMVLEGSADPATIVATRESLRLALIAALQYLPAKQRAVLILREVLAFPAAEVATMLDTSVAAVKSTLQRARARLDENPADAAVEPDDPQAQALLADYVSGFENADLAALERALRADAAIEMVGTTAWFNGRVMCLQLLASALGAPGDWRMLPIVANGQPAVGAYFKGEAYGIAVLTPTATGLTHIHVFSTPSLVTHFGLPLTPPAP
ncbi:sigma-70 family RNA polymerase sigma factor [Kribbella sp. NPDC051586]|uniref:sigma-70 family RNA polymerase sigma factor n=1 Tax=Kribbella sp. NPDC051586 TaxID=3364118 RepID=UPI0037AF92C3